MYKDKLEQNLPNFEQGGHEMIVTKLHKDVREMQIFCVILDIVTTKHLLVKLWHYHQFLSYVKVMWPVIDMDIATYIFGLQSFDSIYSLFYKTQKKIITAGTTRLATLPVSCITKKLQ